MVYSEWCVRAIRMLYGSDWIDVLGYLDSHRIHIHRCPPCSALGMCAIFLVHHIVTSPNLSNDHAKWNLGFPRTGGKDSLIANVVI